MITIEQIARMLVCATEQIARMLFWATERLLECCFLDSFADELTG